jgi:hypothetical protein
MANSCDSCIRSKRAAMKRPSLRRTIAPGQGNDETSIDLAERAREMSHRQPALARHLLQRNRDRQWFLVKGFDIVADEDAQQAAQGGLPRFVPAQSREFLLEGLEGPQTVVLLQEPRI